MNGPLSHTFRRLADGRGVFYGWFEAMHSRFDVLLCGADEAASAALCRRIADETDRIEGRLNRFDEASEAWRLNRSGGGRLHADPETLAVFADAARYRERTDGAFDICVRTPDYTGEGDCYRVDPSCDAIEKIRPEAVVDFGGGYAKGFALERARQCVVAAGVPSALLSFGNSCAGLCRGEPSVGTAVAGGRRESVAPGRVRRRDGPALRRLVVLFGQYASQPGTHPLGRHRP